MGFSVLDYFALAVQFSLGIVFFLSSLPKLRQPVAFARNVDAYKILPSPLAYAFGLVIIPLEFFLIVAFLTGWFIELALPLAFILLVLFLVAVGINLRRGRNISCGCFGNASEEISPRTLARLIILSGVVLLLIGLQSTHSRSFLIGAININTISLLYLVQAAFMAAFLILLTTWLLNLPEWLPIVRHKD